MSLCKGGKYVEIPNSRTPLSLPAGPALEVRVHQRNSQRSHHYLHNTLLVALLRILSEAKQFLQACETSNSITVPTMPSRHRKGGHHEEQPRDSYPAASMATEENMELVLSPNSGEDTNEDSNKNNATATSTNEEDDPQDEFYGSSDGPESTQQRKLDHWRRSAFAVGVVNPSWWDDRPAWCCSTKLDASRRDIDESMPLNAIVCGCIGAGRVGNLAVLAQTTETYKVERVDSDGRRTAEKRTRPRLLWVMGPYWQVNFFLTWPLILGPSGWILYSKVMGNHIAVIVTWSIGTFLLMFSLCMISCRNPGVLYRHAEPPPDTDDWRWNDQAKTYRPPNARFDPETQVVIEGFDHTCPWTGTAIGSRNMMWFRIFVVMVPVMIGYSVILATVGASGGGIFGF